MALFCYRKIVRTWMTQIPELAGLSFQYIPAFSIKLICVICCPDQHDSYATQLSYYRLEKHTQE